MLASLLRILALTRKELLAVLKDKRARFSLLLPPMVQTLIFGYAASYDLHEVPYAVFDQDRSQLSGELLAHLDGTGVFKRIANIQRAGDIARLIDDRRAVIVIQIDSDFERRVKSGGSGNVQVIADGRNSNTAGTAMAYVGSVVETFNAEWRAAHGQAPGLQVVARAWYNPNFETRWNMIPGMIGTLTLLQTMLLTAMSVAREREQGTFDQLLVTPFRPVEIMIGKALPSMLIGLVQATTVLLIAQLWFRIPFAGSFVTLYVGLILFLLAAVGIGLMISAASQTMQQAMLFSFLFIMPFALLSGLTTPVSNMPTALQVFTFINPLRYAIDMTQRVYLEGVGLSRLTHDLWPLVVTAVLTLSAASWLFRHRLQ